MQSEITYDVVEAARVLNMKLHSATELGQRTQWIAEALLAERKAALSDAEPVAWMITETKTSGSKCWKVVEHEYQAHEEARSWSNLLDSVKVIPVYAAPPAPSVAVKALTLDDLKQYFASLDAGDIGWSDMPTALYTYLLMDGYISEDGARQEVRSALSAQVQDVAGWQPIETAPKDGTRLLLMWEPFSGMSEHVELGKWNVRNGWVNTYGHAFSGSPTHFMPLPAAPAKQEG